MMKEAVVVYFKVKSLPIHVTRVTSLSACSEKYKFSWMLFCSRVSGRESNLAPPQYEARQLTNQPRRTVRTFEQPTFAPGQW